ncbi:MAG: hypothetical protein HY527_14980 [Betaproteobacteria bacterium]|nr:hypothetical protein [Betaproteobacteria bacterium]
MQKTPAELYSVHGQRTAAVRAEEQRSFWGFTLNGSTSLEAVARFYGLKVPGLEPGMTVADYLGRICYGAPRPGYRLALGGVELIVQEIEEGTVRKVGIGFPPMTLRPPRRRRPYGKAHSIEPSAARGGGRLTEAADPPC